MKGREIYYQIQNQLTKVVNMQEQTALTTTDVEKRQKELDSQREILNKMMNVEYNAIYITNEETVREIKQIKGRFDDFE